MSRGVCTNLPAACSKAAARTPLPCPDEAARCPECQAALLPIDEDAGRTSGAAVRTVVPALLVALALGGGWWWHQQSGAQVTEVSQMESAPQAAGTSASAVALVAQATKALESEPPGIGTPDMLALHGMDALGTALAPELVEAFLSQEGHVEVHRNEAPGGLGVIVSARPPGGLRQDIRLMFDGGTATAADAGMRRVSVVSGALQDNQVMIGLDALAVVVHPDSPLRQLSMTQLRDLLAGRVLDGARIGAAAGSLKVHVRDARSDAWAQLQQEVLKDVPAGPDLLRHESDKTVVEAVTGDPQSVGVVPLSMVGGAKVLALGDVNGSIWKPTAETVASDRYPLTHRLVMQMPSVPSPMALRYTQFLTSPAAQAKLRERGLASASPVLLDQDSITPVGMGPSVQMPKDYAALTKGARQLAGHIGFAAQSSDLDAVARIDLERMARQLKDQAKESGSAEPVSVMVLGVASDPGGFCANRSLSNKRAETVAQVLAEQGVLVDVVRGVGRFAPAAVATSDAAARDRRVEIWVAEGPVKNPAPFKCNPGAAFARAN